MRRCSFVSSVVVLLLSVSSTYANGKTLVVQWNDVLLQCIRVSKIGPPMVARAIAVAHTCGYDAWAMYDEVAVSTRSSDGPRRPPSERTEANREVAYSYAVYRALLDLFPSQADYVQAQMAAIGYDPNDNATDGATPQGMGNVCAKAVLDFRHEDGSNQLGERHPGAYTDYTGYRPVNTPDEIIDPNHWQPLRFCDGKGGFVSPPYVAPQWGNVLPFALNSWDEFKLPPPQAYPHGEYVAQAEEILQLNAHLDDRQKMIAEYWADGPHSELPPGHFTLFAEYVSERDHHTFDDDVKMFFILGNAEMDAGIAVWGAKRHFDSERPITAIHFLKAGKRVLAYVPFEGPKVIRGEDWMPYQPCSFVTPPFPEYPSGHSAFSAAGAEILKRFTGSDYFGGSVTFLAGSGRVEPGFAPAHKVTLSWDTFSAAADEAGMSRRYGGIHFKEGDLESRRLGREVADVVWDKALSYINGTIATTTLRTPAAVSSIQTGAKEGVVDLRATYPNPASRFGTGFGLYLSRPAPVRATILDVRGRTIAVLADEIMAPGPHTLRWLPSYRVPSGIYFLIVQEPGETLKRKIALVH